jgi:hypothetical protein
MIIIAIFTKEGLDNHKLNKALVFATKGNKRITYYLIRHVLMMNITFLVVRHKYCVLCDVIVIW